MIYFIIFFGKIIEVSLMTVRVTLITKGEKKLGALIGFIEVIIWILIVSNVITGLAEDPLKIIVYALGFAIGSYSGSVLESYIGIGTSQIQIIVREENGEALRQALYDKGYACTMVQGEGKNLTRNILYVIVPRKHAVKVTAMAKTFQDDAVITMHETKPYHGGYGMRK